jgi:hypothetical protein
LSRTGELIAFIIGEGWFKKKTREGETQAQRDRRESIRSDCEMKVVIICVGNGQFVPEMEISFSGYSPALSNMRSYTQGFGLILPLP